MEDQGGKVHGAGMAILPCSLISVKGVAATLMRNIVLHDVSHVTLLFLTHDKLEKDTGRNPSLYSKSLWKTGKFT